MIPTAFLDELRVRTTLSEVIQRSRVTLKRAGREWKACCPFHNEKTPSFTVNDEKGFYHCFGCAAHGDVIRWMIEYDGMQFIDAVKELASRAGLEVPAADPRTAARARQRDDEIEVMESAQRHFSALLRTRTPDDDTAAAVAYIRERGMAKSTVERFGIGFSSKTAPVSQACGVDDSVLERLGLVRVDEETGEVRDFFRRRIMIPIHDPRGRVIAFGGRILGDGQPKYLNSPETPIFDKGRTLFNLHRAAAPARAKKQLLIVEGYMDVIGLDSAGCDFAVAPNGTALTEHQLALAWKLVDTPVVCFDGDSAGKKAANRAIERALPVMEPGKSLRFAFPPDGQDPDDLAKAGGLPAITALIESAQPLIDVLWASLVSSFDMRNPDQKAALRAKIRSILAGIRNEDVRASYAAEMTDRFNGANARQQTARGGRRAANMPVVDAVEDALMLGLLKNLPFVLKNFEWISGLNWRREEHRHIAEDLGNIAMEEQFGSPDGIEVKLDDATVARAIESRGLTGHVASLRGGQTLRMPFLDATGEKAETLLMQALRANFT